MKKLSREELAQIWAEVPVDYYFKQNRLQRLWHDWKWIVIRHLMQLQGSPRQILEVGCSSGHLTDLVKSEFPQAQVTGIDVYPEAIAEAKQRFKKIRFRVADAHKLPFPDGSFDLVICSETIEHVVNPGKVIREIRRVSRPGGRIILEMDSGSWLFRIVWWGWVKFFRGRVWERSHLHPFSARELAQTIRRNGLKIEKKFFSHFGMAVWFWATPNKPN